jgi:Tol biopolymer transport system component
MRSTIVVMALLMAGCAGAPASTSPSRSSTELDGTTLLALDTLYVANADGTEQVRVHDAGEYCCVYRISPDRTRILVMPGTDQTGAVRGGALSLDGSNFELLPRPNETLNLVPEAWSPDGTRIAFEGWDDADPTRTGVYTARLDGSDLVRVTDSGGLPHDTALDYSPDGTQLVFYRAVRAEPAFPIDLGGSLWVVNVDGSDLHQLDTGDVRPGWSARWSPDGAGILFAEERLQPTRSLWTIKPDGSDLTKVFEDPDGGFAGAGVWSPDGSRIMFQIDPMSDFFQHPDNEIYVIRADGTGLTLVVGGPGYKGVTEWWD